MVLVYVVCMYVCLCRGCASAASTLNEQVVNERVRQYVDMEDPECPDIVMDLYKLNTGTKSKYGGSVTNSYKMKLEWLQKKEDTLKLLTLQEQYQSISL